MQVYCLRRAAGGVSLPFANEIQQIMSEVPFDITAVFLMDPIRGPFLPTKTEDLHKAYVAQLRQIEMETTHKQRTTEVDLWLQAVDGAGGLPRHAPLFSLQVPPPLPLLFRPLLLGGHMPHTHPYLRTLTDLHMYARKRARARTQSLQEKLFECGFKHLTDLDQLDPSLRRPGVPGGARVSDAKARQAEILAQLKAVGLPGSPNDHKGIAVAIMKRLDVVVHHCGADGGDEWEELALDQHAITGHIRAEDWNIDRLVSLRTAVYKATRKYRKSKAKFDRSVQDCILTQDLDRAHEELMPWRSVCRQLFRAFAVDDRCPETGWTGLRCPVLAAREGPHALRLEVAFFVLRTYVLPLCKQVAAVLCGLGSLIVLQSELALFPPLNMDALVLQHLCSLAALEPNCLADGRDPSTLPAAHKVLPGFQVTIGLHLLFLCLVMMFVLLRLKIFSFYEMVVGETDAASLLLNAYIVCRLVPALAHNYLALVDEAGSDADQRSPVVFPYVTAFESVFNSLGRIPFVDLDFNRVLPPFTLLAFILTVASSLCKRCLKKLPRLDGEQHKTDDIIDDAELIVGLERRRYEKTFAQSRAFRSRAAPSSETRAGGAAAAEAATCAAIGAAAHWRSALDKVKASMGIEMTPVGKAAVVAPRDRVGLVGADACAEEAAAAVEAGAGESRCHQVEVEVSVGAESRVPDAGYIMEAKNEDRTTGGLMIISSPRQSETAATAISASEAGSSGGHGGERGGWGAGRGRWSAMLREQANHLKGKFASIPAAGSVGVEEASTPDAGGETGQRERDGRTTQVTSAGASRGCGGADSRPSDGSAWRTLMSEINAV